MPLPLIPFIAGAALGSLATYFYQDDNIRRGMKNTAEDVADKVKGTANTVSNKVSSGLNSLRNNSPADSKPEKIDEAADITTIEDEEDELEKSDNS